MSVTSMERVRRLLEPHPVVVMKDHAFEQGFDDLGQAEGDVEHRPELEVPPHEHDAPVSRA